MADATDTTDTTSTTTTVETQEQASGSPAAGALARQSLATRIAIAVACGVLGFVLVTQVRSVEGVGERLQTEREEDLARILSDLTAESDRLQTEITDLRLLLIEYENSQETDELALRSLQQRLAELQILAGVVPAEGEGIAFTVDDPQGRVTQELLVDTMQELRDAGAEAIAVNGTRLVASSAFTTRNERVLVDGQPLDPPYRIAAVGPPDTMASALGIPGGAIDSLERLESGVTTSVEALAHVNVPARSEAQPFVFGRPVTDDEEAEG
jgi:uncharacterized protein YlxW (UPF0749 family)